MNTVLKVLSLFAFSALFILVAFTSVFAAEVTPAVNPEDSTKLYLIYTDIPPGATSVVKRTTGIPTATSVWTPLSAPRPQEDTGLTAGTEYAYALFDADGQMLPNQKFYSQVPNRQIVHDATRVGTQGAGPDGDLTPAREFFVDDAGEIQELHRAETLVGFLARVRGVLNSVIPFIIGLAVFVILWGIFTYITHAAEEEKRAEAKRFIVWGIIGLFFMLSIWGFVNILVGTFAIDKTIRREDIPTVPKLCPPGQPAC